MIALVLCIDVLLIDLVTCQPVDRPYQAALMRGVGDGASTPDFAPLVLFAGRCVSDDEAPPLGSAFFYQVGLVDEAGEPIFSCNS